MIIMWERHFAAVAEALRYISALPAQGGGGYPVYKIFPAKQGRVFVRCQRAAGHCLGR